MIIRGQLFSGAIAWAPVFQGLTGANYLGEAITRETFFLAGKGTIFRGGGGAVVQRSIILGGNCLGGAVIWEAIFRGKLTCSLESIVPYPIISDVFTTL